MNMPNTEVSSDANRQMIAEVQERRIARLRKIRGESVTKPLPFAIDDAVVSVTDPNDRGTVRGFDPRRQGFCVVRWGERGVSSIAFSAIRKA